MSNLSFPNANQPFFDPRTGQVSRAWWRFFDDLISRVGGTGDVADLARVLQMITAAQKDIHDLETQADSVAPATALFVMLLRRIGDLESQVAAMAPVAQKPRDTFEPLAPVPQKRIDDLNPVAVPGVKPRRVSDLETLVNS